MNSAEKSNWFNSKNIVLLLLGLGLIYFISNSMVSSHFKEVELSTRVMIANQQKLLIAIAETTARNGADSITESILRDCTMDERVNFENLLGSLDNNLSHGQLVELERLFGRCGSFRSDRKSVMVSRLAREIEIYESYVNLLSVVVKEDVSESFSVGKWKRLATEEEKQSELFASLVQLQDEIITKLLNGSTPTSPEVTEILQQVGEIKETLLVANKQALNIRSELIQI